MRAIGAVAAVVQVALAATLGVIATGSGAFPHPPEPIPRGLALGVLYALPAVIGALGALGRRRSLLAAASVLSAIGSVLAFSGVTLFFLVPSFLFAAAAGTVTRTQSAGRRRPALGALAGLGVAIVITALAAAWLGVLVLPALAMLLLGLGLLGAHRRAPSAARPSLGAHLVAVVVVGLGAASGWTLLATTETRCWKAYQTPSGAGYRWVPDPGTGPMELRGDAIAGGCDGGSVTVLGATVATGLALSAVAFAAFVAGRPHLTRGRGPPKRER